MRNWTNRVAMMSIDRLLLKAFMFIRLPAAIAFVLVLFNLGACTTAPTHKALASAVQAGQLPELVPVRRFVANIDAAGGYQLAPNGQ